MSDDTEHAIETTQGFLVDALMLYKHLGPRLWEHAVRNADARYWRAYHRDAEARHLLLRVVRVLRRLDTGCAQVPWPPRKGGAVWHAIAGGLATAWERANRGSPGATLEITQAGRDVLAYYGDAPCEHVGPPTTLQEAQTLGAMRRREKGLE